MNRILITAVAFLAFVGNIQAQDDVRDMNVYEDIKTYLTEHFGDFNGEKWVKYPELRKELFLRLDDDRIEFITFTTALSLMLSSRLNLNTSDISACEL